MDDEKRFVFRGNAVGFGGHLRRPEDVILWTQAPSGVPVTGGYCRADAGPYNYKDLVSFGTASTVVMADYADRRKAVKFTHGNHGQNDLPTRTEVNATVRAITVAVRGESITRIMNCRTLTGTLISESDRKSETAIQPLLASIEGLELDGYALSVIINTAAFSKYPTRTAFSAAYEKDDDFFKRYGGLVSKAGQKAPGADGKRRIADPCQPIHSTIVEKIEWVSTPHPDAKIDANRITLPEFGSIYLGELILSSNGRRLTMMRLQLGSPDGGEMTFAETESNGHTWPP